MVKMFAVLRRNPEMTVEEFRTHWREHHGPLIRSHPNLARHIVRYEQHVRHRPDGLSGNDGIDGIAVQWFNSIDDFAGFIAEPEYAELSFEQGLPVALDGKLASFHEIIVAMNDLAGKHGFGRSVDVDEPGRECTGRGRGHRRKFRVDHRELLRRHRREVPVT